MLATAPVMLGVFAEMHPPPVAPQVLAAAAPIAQTAPTSGSAALLSSPVFWVFGFAFLFFVPLETSTAGWATTLVLRQTPSDVPDARAKRFAALTLSGFWLGFTGSRLIVSILGATGVLTRVLGGTNEQALLVTLGVACAVLMLALVLVRGRAATSATILLAGLACGPVFPTMMAVVLLSVQPDTMGRAVGLLLRVRGLDGGSDDHRRRRAENQHPDRFSHRRRVRRGIPDLDCDQGNDDRVTLGPSQLESVVASPNSLERIMAQSINRREFMTASAGIAAGFGFGAAAMAAQTPAAGRGGGSAPVSPLSFKTKPHQALMARPTEDDLRRTKDAGFEGVEGRVIPVDEAATMRAV